MRIQSVTFNATASILHLILLFLSLLFISFLFSLYLLIYSSLYSSSFSLLFYFSTLSNFTFLIQFILNQFHLLGFQNNYPFEDYPVSSQLLYSESYYYGFNLLLTVLFGKLCL